MIMENASASMASAEPTAQLNFATMIVVSMEFAYKRPTAIVKKVSI